MVSQVSGVLLGLRVAVFVFSRAIRGFCERGDHKVEPWSGVFRSDEARSGIVLLGQSFALRIEIRVADVQLWRQGVHFTTRRVFYVWLFYSVLVFHRLAQFGRFNSGGIAEKSSKRLGGVANPHERKLGRIGLVVLIRWVELTDRTPFVPRDGAQFVSKISADCERGVREGRRAVPRSPGYLWFVSDHGEDVQVFTQNGTKTSRKEKV